MTKLSEVIKDNIFQELCDCAFEQGYGGFLIKGGKYKPAIINKNVIRKLLIIYKEDLEEKTE